MYPEWHRACCELHLNFRRIVQRRVAGQHLPQADVHKVVPPFISARTIGVHARLECRIRVRAVCDEITHHVYQTPASSPEGQHLHQIGGDKKRHSAIEDCATYR